MTSSTPEYQPMKVANALLADTRALQAQMDEDGYLFFRGLLPNAVLAALRDDVTAVLHDIGWIRGGADRLAAESQVLPCREGEPRYFEALDRIQRLERFHALAHEPALLQLMAGLLGEGAFPHPLGVMRLVFPDNPEVTTPPHQDYRNNQGTPRLTAAWIPLMDCSRDCGPLAILPGSQRSGVLPLAFHLGPGNRQAVLPQQMAGTAWVTEDFRVGDVLLFPSLTVHRALPNQHPSRMRLSVDFRYQPAGEALTAQSLLPHFARQSWEEIYAGWSSSTLQHYWRDREFTVVPWDESLHALPPGHWNQALREDMIYERMRQRRFRTRGAPQQGS
ncbi:MAG: phytanoyl-CoA dioxygenase family protein [Haliea sp.]|nr:phytanoyl-CoA dioxygenase family protein [Haliea sp.]